MLPGDRVLGPGRCVGEVGPGLDAGRAGAQIRQHTEGIEKAKLRLRVPDIASCGHCSGSDSDDIFGTKGVKHRANGIRARIGDDH